MSDEKKLVPDNPTELDEQTKWLMAQAIRERRDNKHRIPIKDFRGREVEGYYVELRDIPNNVRLGLLGAQRVETTEARPRSDLKFEGQDLRDYEQITISKLDLWQVLEYLVRQNCICGAVLPMIKDGKVVPWEYTDRTPDALLERFKWSGMDLVMQVINGAFSYYFSDTGIEVIESLGE